MSQLILYAATSNAGKLRDFATAAAVHGIEVAPLPNLANIPAPPEDEPSFEGNARLKAIYYSQAAGAYSELAPGQIVIADDSGLETAALEGAPGVRSARYAEDMHFQKTPGSSTDERNNACLLHAMADIPDACREARYRCVLAAARNGQVLHIAEGSVEGRILHAPQGEGGFGYDPLFLIPELNQTMAEISLETKHELSHRGRAFRALLQQLHP
jgi:XTP/dITP diphosphohydrolase